MPEPRETMDALSEAVRGALERGDLASYRELLDPDVTWGPPGARKPTCRNRDQVLAWYEGGRERGVRAQVHEVSVHGDRLLVNLAVAGSPESEKSGDVSLRWQVMTVRLGLIVDIVGFDDRRDALVEAGVSVG